MTEQAPDRKTFNKKILIPIAIAAPPPAPLVQPAHSPQNDIIQTQRSPNRGPLSFASTAPRRHLKAPMPPWLCWSQANTKRAERAAEALAGAAAHPLVSCKAPSMCRPVRCLPYLVGGTLCTLVQSNALKQVLLLEYLCTV